jgi:hypothetical protein
MITHPELYENCMYSTWSSTQIKSQTKEKGESAKKKKTRRKERIIEEELEKNSVKTSERMEREQRMHPCATCHWEK